ncbi:DUF998 domain-containing protein [Paenibacillus sp. SYP-B3998]|uniref:DUF998 domain-containing protein n=1 Tax=Paenibacillus sp. SYP-B3998 TaxID=2678564 RepID=A0A6G4A6A7_9BACL|nr:DUF998 domain-containing protein [Paenibacillus sp. SYP-B3998]NEW09935.1 DUF998 domain-containing protein [Paenibacillus sp. SYP-B3998]
MFARNENRRLWIARLGAIAWIFGTIQFFVVHIIVQWDWTIPYNWSFNNISDLGNIYCQAWGDNQRYVCSPLHGYMNISFILEGVAVIIGVILLGFLWHGIFGSWTARILLLIAGIGWIIVGREPADVNENLHVLGALFIMVLGNVGLILTKPVRVPSYARNIRIFSLAIGVIGLVATGLFFTGHYLGLGMGGMERIAALTMQMWTFTVG